MEISVTFKVQMMIELANASLEFYTFFFKKKTLCRCMSAFKFRTTVKDSLMQQHINFSFENLWHLWVVRSNLTVR